MAGSDNEELNGGHRYHGEVKTIIKVYEVGDKLFTLIEELFERPVLLERIAELEAKNRELQSKVYLGENKIMAHYTLKDNQPEVDFELVLGDVMDEEGAVITDPAVLASLVKTVTPTDPAVIGYNPTDPADQSKGKVVFGTIGQANLNYSVAKPDGTVLATGSDGFTLVAGDPNSVASVTGNFAGLTPDDAPTA